MIIRMVTTLASPDMTVRAGDIVKVVPAIGKPLIDSGYAILIKDEPEKETAMMETTEKAVIDKPAPRHRRKRK